MPSECQLGWLDAAGMARVLASSTPALLRFDRPGCGDCSALDPLWDMMREQMRAEAYRIDCSSHLDVCSSMVGLTAVHHGARHAPIIHAWTGNEFLPYEGERSAEALVVWFRRLAAGEAVTAPAEREDATADEVLDRLIDEFEATLDGLDGSSLEGGRVQRWPGAPIPTTVFMPAASRVEGRHPIIVYLHGTPPSGRFDEPYTHSLPWLLQSNSTFASHFPFIALFPCSACEESGRPVRISGPPPTSGRVGWVPFNFRRIDALVSATVRLYDGDPHRVVLTGQSYGGRGVWDYGAARPGMFSALVPICAAATPSPAAVAALCCASADSCCPSVWAFHGANDVRAAVGNTDLWVSLLRAQPHRRDGQPVRYTRYDEAPPLSGQWEGHASDQLAYLDQDLWDWLVIQRCEGCAPDGLPTSVLGRAVHGARHGERGGSGG